MDRELDEHWIVCLAETRGVRTGRVACPLRDGRAAAFSQCADCRLLEWQRDERRNGNSCWTVPGVTIVVERDVVEPPSGEGTVSA